MSRKFTAKPIRIDKNIANKKEQAEEEIIDFYKETNDFPEIKKPINNKSVWLLVVLLSILFGFASSLVYDFFFIQKTGFDGEQKIFIEKQEEVTVTSEERLKNLAAMINPVNGSAQNRALSSLVSRGMPCASL